MFIFDVLKNICLIPLELIFEIIFTVAYKITHSNGVAIIILSIVVSTVVLPLYNRAERLEQEQREKEKQLSHWVDHIKRNFTGDEKYMMLDAYYRENNYNPLSALKSTISILLQIPFFMAAYDLLGVRASTRFSGTAFLFFENLGAPDRLIAFGDVTINVLPFVMALVNIISCYFYTKGLPFKTAVRSYILAIVFLVLLYNSPSALLIYWTMNNVYSLVKTIILKKVIQPKQQSAAKKTAKAAVAETEGPTTGIEKILGRNPDTALFVLSALFLAVLTGLMIPLSYLSASPEEFIIISAPQNPLHYLMSSFFVALGFFMLWPGVFYYLVNKKNRIVFSVSMFGISVFSTVNYLFFGTDLGTLNTSLVFNITPVFLQTQVAINTVVVLLILVACLFLYRFRKILRIVYVAGIMALLTLSFINAGKVNDAYKTVAENYETFSEAEAPKITLSTNGNNVMVIMLDKAVSGYLPYAMNEFPELQEQFDGFVFYPNTMSFAQNTLKTTSALFGGYEYTPERMDARADETLAEKHDESLKVMPKIFSEQGYTSTLMELPFAGWSWNGDYSAFDDIENCNYYYPKDFFSNNTEAIVNIENRRNRDLFMYSIFRCSPMIFQEFIYDSGDYLTVMRENFDKSDVLENYKVLENLDDMTQVTNDNTGCLFMMDNQTTHDLTNLENYDPYSPCEFDEGFYISDGTDELYIWHTYQAASYECFVAAMLEMGSYMDYLREIGVYDNTRIIIVSDHATSVGLFEDLIFCDVNGEWYNCLLMVKDFDSTGFTTDYTFMTNADVPTIALEGIVDDPVNPYTGNPINSDMKNGDLYVSYSLNYDEELWNPDQNAGNTFIYDDDCIWFKVINQNIFDEDNWVLTDKPS